MISSVSSSSYDKTKDPRFLAFSRLATEGSAEANVTDKNRYSMSFTEFCHDLEKGEIVDSQNAQNNTYNNSQSQWEFRIKESLVSKTNSQLGSEVLDIIKKAYDLGMVNNDNMLLRSRAIKAYKSSI
ncbi:hypothetical protein [Heyndrickxia ginsengihumi]|uniref:Uncharacterized protein n=1 Tax=Heyndrickxia ginsengihumi TaxID=363870 RepID=A0A0A6V9F8_9BACI|nr:hypothetical protein [Heyndrickxia ginsengihumi]KHD84211.1 hypothetical protein NG54_16990 [Heyndrickxia ginsengihumi]MBE6184049.1 hypothetical protein [Bacillus sp. (in: firmicutes)]NEY18779.1 hypothetical protein [Heyndrickxia ginsengihumi]